MSESHEAHEAQQALLVASETEPVAQPAVLGPPSDSPRASPGSLLRAAREARGLSIAEVTHSIKFSARQIEAVECDDFDKLPGNTFLRGIIRSYAKLLRLDAEPLLAMLGEQLPPADSEVHAPEDTGAKLPLTGERRSFVPLLALLLTLAAIVVALVSYFDWPNGAEKAKSTQAKAGQVQLPAVRIEQPASAEVSSPSPLPPDSHELIFVFADKSWVEVKDATQKIIFAQNNLAGTRQVVSGKPPFDLVIGNASAVQLQYGEKQIDLRPYTKVEVARLSLE